MLSKIVRIRSGKIPKICLLLLVLVLVAGCAGAPLRPWSGAAMDDEFLVVGSLDGRVIVLKDVATGSPDVLWSEVLESRRAGGNPFECGGGFSVPMRIYATPNIAEGRVYIGGYDGYIYSFDIATGSRREFGTGGHIVGGAAVAGDSVFVGNSEGKLFAFNLLLNEQWQFKTRDKVWSTPAVHDGVVYVTSTDHKLYAIDAASGKEIWNLTTGAGIVSTPVVHDGVIYVGSLDWKFYAVDVATDAEKQAATNRPAGTAAPSRDPKWVFGEGEGWYWTEALVHENRVWVGNLDGNLYVIDLDDPGEYQAYDMGGGVSSSPVVIDGKVVAGTQEGVLYSIDEAGNVDRLWSVARGPDEEATLLAPLLADPAEGLVYVHAWYKDGAGNEYDKLYAVSVETTETIIDYTLSG